MPTPMLDPNRAGNFSASSSRKNQEESPLASQLPSWDLLPAHTVLDRRSSTRTPAAPPALPSIGGSESSASTPSSDAATAPDASPCGSLRCGV